jgi:CDGSH-type Zn-finger protein
MENNYKVLKTGDGSSPHILENVDNPTDKVFLCSCGGTSDVNGHCDGTHRKKSNSGCSCHFCKPKEERVEHKL